MDARPVDERDTTWESYDLPLRVFLYEVPGMATQAFDMDGATLLEATEWAVRNQPAAGAFSIAMRSTDAGGKPGLIWLVGSDLSDTPRSDIEMRLHAERLGRDRSA